MPKTRIALAGFGVIGKKHAAVLIDSQSCELTAIVDPDTVAKNYALTNRVSYHQTLENLFLNSSVDGVLLATPTSMHCKQAVLCAKKGIHILIEKPIAASLKEAKLIIKTGKKNKIHILSGHYRRFNKQVETARDIILSGKIGNLVGVSAIWAMKKHDEYYDIPWRTQKGGGPILTNLIHDIDCLRYICGDIESVSSHVSNKTRQHAVEDTAAISLSFENGALGTILLSDAAPGPWSFEASTGENHEFSHMDDCCYRFIGTKGAFDFPLLRIWTYASQQKAAWHYPMLKTQMLTSSGYPLKEQIEHFGRVIREQEVPRTSGEDGAKTLSVALAIIEAASTGTTVKPRDI